MGNSLACKARMHTQKHPGVSTALGVVTILNDNVASAKSAVHTSALIFISAKMTIYCVLQRKVHKVLLKVRMFYFRAGVS